MIHDYMIHDSNYSISVYKLSMSIRHFLSIMGSEFAVFNQDCMNCMDAGLAGLVGLVGLLAGGERRFGARCSCPNGLVRSFVTVCHKSDNTWIAC